MSILWHGVRRPHGRHEQRVLTRLGLGEDFTPRPPDYTRTFFFYNGDSRYCEPAVTVNTGSRYLCVYLPAHRLPT